jgi:hypothetical protein
MTISKNENYSKRFVIITQPRSGSYYFQSLLDSADDIVCHGEIFKESKIELSTWQLRKLGLAREEITTRDQEPFIFLSKVRNLTPYKIFGFKAFIDHIQKRPGLKNNILASPDWKKIFLVRNPLSTYASLRRAQSSGKWVLKNGLNNPDSEDLQVLFEKEGFSKHFAMYQRFINHHDACNLKQKENCFLLEYHQLQNEDTLNKILQFVGSSANASTLQSEYKKQYEGQLSDSFSNFDELLLFLREIGHEDLVESSHDYLSFKKPL